MADVDDAPRRDGPGPAPPAPSETTPPTRRATLTYPLRGLASEGADVIVRAALRDLDGVDSVAVRIAEALAHVTYDPAVTTAAAIEARLHTAGRTHPTGADGAHGHTRAR